MYEVDIDKERFINEYIKALNDNIHTKSKYFIEGTGKLAIDKQKELICTMKLRKSMKCHMNEIKLLQDQCYLDEALESC